MPSAVALPIRSCSGIWLSFRCHSGSGQGGFAAGVGARVVWETGAVRNGRRVRGSTFVVPIWSSAYETNGTLHTATINDLVRVRSTMAQCHQVFVETKAKIPGVRPGKWGDGDPCCPGIGQTDLRVVA